MRMIARLAGLLAVALLAAGCGSSNSTDLSGNWSATTTSSQGGQSLTFTFTMQQGASNGNTIPVIFSNLAFTTANNCFSNAANMTGQITPGTPELLAVDMFSGANNTGNHMAMNLTVAPDLNSATGNSGGQGYVLTGGTNGCVNDVGTIVFTRQ